MTPSCAEQPPPGAAGAAPEESPPAAESGSERLVSLDAFRGLTIAGMLLVNNTALGAATPRQLTHAPWNGGVYFADLVFPWFLFIVGVAIPYAATSARKKGVTGGRYLMKVLGRAAALVLLGLLVDSSLARRPVFGLGVLQLIGLAYACGALMAGLRLRWRLTAAGLLLLGHWAAIRFIPVPGLGAGAFAEDGNLIHYLNQVYLQPIGLKGLVSVVPTTALVLIGTAAGEWLRADAKPLRRAAGLLAGGGALTLLGWLWSLDLPFNKPVWTASYILYAAGLGAATLGLFYLLVDAKGWRAAAFPLVVFGSNAIVAYVAPILVKIHILQEWSWPAADGSSQTLQQALLQAAVDAFGRVPGGWLYTLGYLLFWWTVLLVLYQKRLFLRV